MTTTTTDRRTMADVKRANKALGHHFFEPAALRFFDGRVGATLYGGRYFVTSEQMHGSTGSLPRAWTVRAAHDDGSIHTVGEFQAHATRDDAIAAARVLAHGA